MINERPIAKRRPPVVYGAAKTFCQIPQRLCRTRPMVVVGQIATLGMVIAATAPQPTCPPTPFRLIWRRKVAVLGPLAELLDSP